MEQLNLEGADNLATPVTTSFKALINQQKRNYLTVLSIAHAGDDQVQSNEVRSVINYPRDSAVYVC